jgi:hypothetical protein
MDRPTGVTIIAVLGFIGAGLSLLAGLGMFLGGAVLSSMAGRPGMGMIAGIGGAFVGIVFLGIAAVYLVTAIGLWKLQDWARILTVVLSIIGAVLNGFGMLRAMLHLHIFGLFIQAIFVAIDVWVAVYLLQSNVKQAFVENRTLASSAT